MCPQLYNVAGFEPSLWEEKALALTTAPILQPLPLALPPSSAPYSYPSVISGSRILAFALLGEMCFPWRSVHFLLVFFLTLPLFLQSFFRFPAPYPPPHCL